MQDVSQGLPLVSVIIPIYNGEMFLTQAIESVISQTYTEWEIILVDDGSTDGSLFIAKDYVYRYPDRILLFYHTEHINKGTAATRNLGIDHTRGEYIANLDQDDIWTKTKLEEQVAILDAHPTVAMTFCPMIIWTSWKNTERVEQEQDQTQSLTFPLDTLFQPPSFIPLLLSEKNDPHGYLMRRSTIEDVGKYVEHVGICEDWALYVKIALNYPIFVGSLPNYCYRQHETQTCNLLRQAGKFYDGYTSYYEWLWSYLANNKSTDMHVLLAFHAALNRFRQNHRKEVA
jgi:glycosyltransferase involved in cell wall biosynthesis